MYIRCLMESEVLTLMGLYLYTHPLHATSLRWNFFSIPVRTFKKNDTKESCRLVATCLIYIGPGDLHVLRFAN